MYCPKCSKPQTNDQVRFCPGCGFLLTGVGQMLATGGIPDQYRMIYQEEPSSPRKKGLKTGLFLFLSTFLVVPLIALATIAAGAEPFFVAAAAIITFWGGILRMIYALLFESNQSGQLTLEQKIHRFARQFFNKNHENSAALPPRPINHATAYIPPTAGSWRDTNDLAGTRTAEDQARFWGNRS